MAYIIDELHMDKKQKRNTFLSFACQLWGRLFIVKLLAEELILNLIENITVLIGSQIHSGCN